MYENAGKPANPFAGIEGGINSGFKIASYEVTDTNWKLTFKKGEFSVNFLGNFPYLADGKESSWSAANYYWSNDFIAIFQQFIPEEQIAKIRTAIVEKINAENLSETSKEDILKAAKIFVEGLFEAATEYFNTVEFNVVLAYKAGLDKELNEKWYLNIPLVSTKDGNKWQDEAGNWLGGYPFAVGKNPPMNPNLTYVNPKPYVREEKEVPAEQIAVNQELLAEAAFPTEVPAQDPGTSTTDEPTW